jgi:hypothetical protein
MIAATRAASADGKHAVPRTLLLAAAAVAAAVAVALTNPVWFRLVHAAVNLVVVAI